MCICLLLVFTVTSHAQQLNLKPRYAPKPNDGVTSLVLINRLEGQHRDRAPLLGADPASNPRLSITDSLAMLAHDLLQRGEELGIDGSMLVVAGRTLADDLPELEKWVTPERFDDATLAAIARELHAAGAEDAKLLPAETGPLFRVLRDRLSPLVPGGAGPDLESRWWLDGAGAAAPAPVLLEDLAKAAKLDEVMVTRAGVLDGLLREAAEHPSFWAGAAQVRRTSEPLAGLVQSPPAWFIKASPAVGTELSRAIVDLADHEQSPTGLLRLRRLAFLSRGVRQASVLRDSPASRRLDEALLRAAMPLTDPPSHAQVDLWRRLAEALDVANTPPAQREDLDRALRPALPVLVAATDESRLTLVGTLPRLLEAQGVSTDPGIVSAMAAHRRHLADIEMLGDLSSVLADATPAPGAKAPPTPGTRRPDPNGVVRAHVLKLAQDIAKPGLRDVAITELRDLGRGMAIFKKFDHEDELRAAPKTDSLVARALGDNRQPLLDLIDRSREAWMSGAALAIGADRPVDTQGPVLFDAVDAYIQACVATSPEAISMLNEWPAFRMSPKVAAGLTSSLAAPLDACANALRAQRSDKFIAGATDLRKHAMGMVLGRLALTAPDHRTGKGLPASLAELAMGGPDPDAGWMAAQAEHVAVICHYGFELDATSSLERTRREELVNYLIVRARIILNATDAPQQ